MSICRNKNMDCRWIIRRLRVPWLAGAIVALSIFCLGFRATLRSPAEFAATAHLKLEFFLSGPDAQPLTTERFVTNAPRLGWGPLITEGVFLRSEPVVHKALQKLAAVNDAPKPPPNQKLDSPNSVVSARARLESGCAPGGLFLKGVSADPSEAASLVNAVADAYRDERNLMAPAPPGCGKISIQVQAAKSAVRVPAVWKWSRLVFTSLLLGFGAAICPLRGAAKNANLFLPNFFRWLAFSLAGFLWFTHLTLAMILVGSTLLAFLMAGAPGCIALTLSASPCVHPRVLAGTFWIPCVLLIGFAALFPPAYSRDAARVHVAVTTPVEAGELAAGYNPKFLETESRLIQSSVIMEKLADSLLDEAVESPQPRQPELVDFHFGPGHEETSRMRDSLPAEPTRNWLNESQFTRADLAEFHSSRSRSEVLEGSSLIDISYVADAPRRAQMAATRLAEIYREYWEARSKTNATRRVDITVLTTSRLPKTQRQRAEAYSAAIISSQGPSVLWLLMGALCVVLLAKKPVWLAGLPLFVLGYFLALGLASVLAYLAEQRFTAVCQVRIWPPASASTDPMSPKKAGLHGESAICEKTLDRAAQVLHANGAFATRNSAEWDHLNAAQRRAWIQEKVQAFQLPKTYLLVFLARTRAAQDAVDIANAMGSSFCELAPVISREVTGTAAEVEMFEQATRPRRLDRQTNPVMDGLLNGLSGLVFFLIGSAIGYGGHLVEKARRARCLASAQPITVT